ncbi:SANT/Myb domain [Dillenia turbinata]|uniref:SANT/Myb domain n=1 Tax=Dillenia turbinata TaxID=194707 RepID=A0AAN8ZPM2_9MAGN
MASPSELSLECKPMSYSMLLKSVADHPDQIQKLENFLARLEDERFKIDGLKRELPLCMQLLTNAVEASKQQLQAYRANQAPGPVLEEFIPIKHSNSEGSDKKTNISDKANWMISAQLWSQASDPNKQQQQQSTAQNPPDSEIGFNVSPKLALENKQRNGGAFLPFSKDRNQNRTLPELALASNDKEMEDKKCSELENGMLVSSRRENSSKISNGGAVSEQGKGVKAAVETQTNATAGAAAPTQTHRKARRCWSPDLHRRFVNALQMLGGSQVATPKQIRELMKVDGLTNDEVKSHLQKYRLHTRRPSPSPQAAGTPTPQLVVLGGIWVPPEYATAAAVAHGGATTIYGAHPPAQPPPHFCAPPPVPQEFYPPQPHHPQLVHHNMHHQLHVYKASSQAHSSPDSDVRGNGDRSESIEDGKSESSSWKGGESGGENGGERKGQVARREDREESNGSEITLKF